MDELELEERAAVDLGGHRAARLGLVGALIGVGAPGGWLLVELMRGHGVVEALTRDPLLYSYMLFACVAAFAIFGAVLGRQEDRLLQVTHKLDELAITDNLTGLHNRRYFMRRLEQAVAQSVRRHEDLALAIVDLDHFKGINDRHGHPVGDAVLQAAAAAMAGEVRVGEVVARVGGEEFAVLMPGADAAQAWAVAERIREAVERGSTATTSAGVAVGGTASVGVGIYHPMDGAVGRTLYAVADAALYRAKECGRNRTCVAHLYDEVAARPSIRFFRLPTKPSIH